MDFLPSLQQSAAISIAVGLWTTESMIAVCNKSFHKIIKRQEYLDTEAFKAVTNKLSKLIELQFTPKTFEPFLRSALEAVAKDINWLVCNYPHVWFQYTDKLYWNSVGNVDKESLARLMVDNEEMEILCRYEVACQFCLAENIPDLYRKLIEDPGGMHFVEKTCRSSDETLATYWTKSCNDMDVPSTSDALDIAVRRENLDAVKYFIKKLMSEGIEIPDLIGKGLLAGRMEDVDTFCFLVRHMNDSEQAEVFRRVEFEFTFNFLDWPWQDVFLKHFSGLLQDPFITFRILNRVTTNMKIADYSTYRRIFRDVWYQNSHLLRFMVLRYQDFYYMFPNFLMDLFLLGDIETADLVVSSTFVSESNATTCDCFQFETEPEKFLQLVKQCPVCLERIRQVVKELLDMIDYNIFTEFFRVDKWSYVELCLLRYLDSEEVSEFKRSLAKKIGDYYVRTFVWDDIDLLDKINSWFFGGYNGKFSFRRRFIRSSGKDFCIKRIRKNEWQKLEQFVVWTCFTDVQIERFKKELVFSKDGLNTCIHLALKYLNDKSDIESSGLMKFLSWSLVKKDWLVQFQDELKKLCLDYFRDNEEDTEMVLSAVNSAINFIVN